VDRLRSWRIHRIFGYSGDGIDPILAAIRRAGGDPELVTARHEESAAFMATGHAKWTGTTGCCLATHGPGAIHLLNGLYDGKLDKRPVLAIIAQQHQSVLGSGYQQEIDAHSPFKDVCHSYLGTITTANARRQGVRGAGVSYRLFAASGDRRRHVQREPSRRPAILVPDSIEVALPRKTGRDTAISPLMLTVAKARKRGQESSPPKG
jgi:hypothetical protein